MTIEKAIRRHLKSEMREAALEFTAYLDENNLTPKQWFNQDFWRIPYKEYYLCGIHLDKNRWRFWFWSGEYSGEFEESFIKVVHDHVGCCISCHGDNTDICPKGKDQTVFGKEFADACIQFTVQFENPDGDTLERIKQLLEYWKTAAPGETSWHYRD